MFYEPAAAAYENLIKDDAALAKKLVQEKAKLVENFSNGKLSISKPRVAGSLADIHVGDKFDLTVDVQLGGLLPEDVEVDAYCGTVNAHNEIIHSQAVPMQKIADYGNGNYLYGCTVFCECAGRFGLTSRIKASGSHWDNSVPGFVCWPK